MLSLIMSGCALPDMPEMSNAPIIVLSDSDEATLTEEPFSTEEPSATDDTLPADEASATDPVSDATDEPVAPVDEPDDVNVPDDIDDPEDEGLARAGCDGNNGSMPEAVEAMAEDYGVTPEVIMGWFCQGYGLGEIKLAYKLSAKSGKSVNEIFAMRKQGIGWGEIMAELDAKPGQGCNPHDENCEKPGQGCNPHDEDCEKPNGGPPADRGNSDKKDK
ncbi:MAG: hypothetical protein JXB07_03440 [Anaerolineae bacterium]|nr:hypothetical protein [Anaerolineae bacterium]